uniref:non-specific serine/threonine protein kinase n=1 Tax=Araucaria cunninghamii TaxID=56994 RepID=A0A0D6R2N7_ARACU
MLTDFDLSLIIPEKPKTRASFEDPKKMTKTSSSWPLLGKLNPIGAKGCMEVVASSPKQQGGHGANMSKSNSTKDAKYAGMDSNKRKAFYEQSYSFVGTEEYVAPEVLWGTGHGFAVDWWAFGILLYEMVCGKSPFKGCTRKDTFYNVLCKEPELLGPPMSPLKDLLQRLLMKEPSRRLGSNSGAEEIKRHKFFEGVKWEELVYVSRPPFVPPPFSIDRAQGAHNNGKMKEKLETF